MCSSLNSQLLQINFNNNYQKFLSKQGEAGIEALRAYRKSFNSETKKFISNPVVEHNRSNLKPHSR